MGPKMSEEFISFDSCIILHVSLCYQRMKRSLQCTVVLVNQTALRALLCFLFKQTGAHNMQALCFNSSLYVPMVGMYNSIITHSMHIYRHV